MMITTNPITIKNIIMKLYNIMLNDFIDNFYKYCINGFYNIQHKEILLEIIDILLGIFESKEITIDIKRCKNPELYKKNIKNFI